MPNEHLPPHLRNAAPRPEVAQGEFPAYPLLSISELSGSPAELDQALRPSLPLEAAKYLKPYQRVVHVQPTETVRPSRPLDALSVVMRAAHASTPEQIGYSGPTVASVNPLEDSAEPSRFEDQHGRDDLQAAEDMEADFPALGDATLITLATSQGIEKESNIDGVPFGQEQLGSIILVDKKPDDIVGQKFTHYLGWRYPRYTSADAPGSFINLLARKQRKDASYLLRYAYPARDGQTYTLTKAFERSAQWIADQAAETAENPEGLIEYKLYGYGGMRNQGWRDSASAMVHADGTWANAELGVSAIEVQGISYDAARNAAEIFRSLYQDYVQAAQFDEIADRLQKCVVENGYVQDSRGGYFVSGWDRDDSGNLRQLRVRTSAMGRLLKSDILKSDNPEIQEMLRSVILTIMGPDMLTRWGLRTISAGEPSYVPFEYHRGPVWPHDTNEVAAGLSGHGFFGLDRIVGATTTNLHKSTGLFLEHVSGYDSEEPDIPARNTYVFDELQGELYLFEQVPTIAQTWAASSEYAKQRRYQQIPLHATDFQKLSLEKQIWRELPDHLRKVVMQTSPDLAFALTA